MTDGRMESTETPTRALIRVKGTVQGVGFRPFVYNLARDLGLKGSVWNSSQGVLVDVEGPGRLLETFVSHLERKAPPLAKVDEVSIRPLRYSGFKEFKIVASRAEKGTTLVPPDVATCPECHEDIINISNRRLGYAFTNCTNCGPRFSIILATPYDRDKTTMAPFEMCTLCRKEYDNPGDRRFHAQPNACPTCGPHLTLLDGSGNVVEKSDPISETAALLLQGHIVAVKGLGGFHLACDALNGDVIERLRRRKRRPHKPLAVMVPDIGWANELCLVGAKEVEMLTSPASPIVLVPRREGCPLPAEVAPRNRFVGLFLPYTPLHHLLLDRVGKPLIMTSGNPADEPICRGNEEAQERLHGVADYFLVHNRKIHSRCDDSVVTVVEGRTMPLRRSRGYVPQPIRLGVNLTADVLGCGADLKNAFCLARDDTAFAGQYVGDLQSYRNVQFWKEALEHMCSLYSFEPEIVAHDLHPGYVSTDLARSLEVDRTVGVQHHHAHIASCMAEAHLDEAIGVAFDGTGYGTDGAVWGGEFLLCHPGEFERLAHLDYLPMPGGEMAIRQPWRMAMSYLHHAYGDEASTLDTPHLGALNESKVDQVMTLIRRRISSPMTSSMGRLFDAVASLVGVRQEITYEGQAAIELQMMAAEKEEGLYPFMLADGSPPWRICTEPIIRSVMDDVLNGIRAERIAARFHNTVASIIIHTVSKIVDQTGKRTVVLSGGVFQNLTLLASASRTLERLGLEVFYPQEVPPSDQGVSLGQVLVAAEKGGVMRCA